MNAFEYPKTYQFFNATRFYLLIAYEDSNLSEFKCQKYV